MFLPFLVVLVKEITGDANTKTSEKDRYFRVRGVLWYNLTDRKTLQFHTQLLYQTESNVLNKE